VQHIVGSAGSLSVSSESLKTEEELDNLRNRVDELTDEVRLYKIAGAYLLIFDPVILQRAKLRDEIRNQVAEINTLKALPLTVPGADQPNGIKSISDVRRLT